MFWDIIHNMPALDAKTIASIVTALGLLYGEIREKKADDNTRHDVSYGMLSYVDAEMAERDKEIADLKIQIAELRRKR